MRWLSALVTVGALLAGSLSAGDLTLSATDNGDGTLTIGMVGYSAEPPIGIALILDPNSPTIQNLQRGQPYYDILTTFDATSQRITAFAALSTLGEQDVFPVQVQNLMTLDFGGPAYGMIEDDTLHGGIVDTQGQPLISNLPLAFIVTDINACSCYGDVADTLQNPGADGIVDFGDLNLVVGEAANSGFTIEPVPAYLICADLSDSFQNPGPDGKVDFGDINYLTSQLVATGFVTTCILLP